ncbi:MAG: hypothetical protein ACMXYL_04720, partial [Candidatus Woesearchaeota archaeon]
MAFDKLTTIIRSVARTTSIGLATLALSACPMNDVDNGNGVKPPPGRLVECPFNPAVEYALENN